MHAVRADLGYFPRAWRCPAPSPEGGASGWFGARRPRRPAPRLRQQSVDPQTGIGGLRLDEDHRRVAQDPFSGPGASPHARRPGRRRLPPWAHRTTRSAAT
jgi:hypothetical protein